MRVLRRGVDEVDDACVESAVLPKSYKAILRFI